jgi:hypothetical protein
MFVETFVSYMNWYLVEWVIFIMEWVFGFQSFRGGRDRPRRGYPSRSDEKGRGGRSSAPPSRHLWVGNLSHTLTERMLSNHFRDFGELESVAFQPGRSYAFINFIDEGAAFAAFEGLQGFILAGNALRIEFTKAVSLVHPCLLRTFCICTVYVLSIICLRLKLISALNITNLKDANQCPFKQCCSEDLSHLIRTLYVLLFGSWLDTTHLIYFPTCHPTKKGASR